MAWIFPGDDNDYSVTAFFMGLQIFHRLVVRLHILSIGSSFGYSGGASFESSSMYYNSGRPRSQSLGNSKAVADAMTTTWPEPSYPQAAIQRRTWTMPMSVLPQQHFAASTALYAAPLSSPMGSFVGNVQTTRETSYLDHGVASHRNMNTNGIVTPPHSTTANSVYTNMTTTSMPEPYYPHAQGVTQQYVLSMAPSNQPRQQSAVSTVPLHISILLTVVHPAYHGPTTTPYYPASNMHTSIQQQSVQIPTSTGLYSQSLAPSGRYIHKGYLKSNISLVEAQDCPELLDNNPSRYSLHDLHTSQGLVLMDIAWVGYYTRRYGIPIKASNNNRIDLQSLARRIFRACNEYFQTNRIPIPLDQVNLQRIEEISYGIWQPILTSK
ncbi:hypothetical protein EV360DRAFT_68220 [Lentinula raphanica]|nr:hypothetical protein EV360DRAFT_68220 [Lentinula raphanica]